MSTVIDRVSSNDLASKMTEFVKGHHDEPIYIANVIEQFSGKIHDDQDVQLTILELIESHRILLSPSLELSVRE